MPPRTIIDTNGIVIFLLKNKHENTRADQMNTDAGFYETENFHPERFSSGQSLRIIRIWLEQICSHES